jgi:DNA-binding NtrC family response regulator
MTLSPILIADAREIETDAPQAATPDGAPRDWPGNVRELRPAVRLCDQPGAAPTPAVLADAFDPALSFREAKRQAIERWERWYVAQLLDHTRGNLSKAARVVDSDRSYLRKLVRKYLGLVDAGGDALTDG